MLMVDGVSGGVSTSGLFTGLFLWFFLALLEPFLEFCLWPWIGLLKARRKKKEQLANEDCKLPEANMKDMGLTDEQIDSFLYCCTSVQ